MPLSAGDKLGPYTILAYFIAEYLPTDSRLDSLRADPRFAELRKRVGLTD
jgi:hypothetical protein